MLFIVVVCIYFIFFLLIIINNNNNTFIFFVVRYISLSPLFIITPNYTDLLFILLYIYYYYYFYYTLLYPPPRIILVLYYSHSTRHELECCEITLPLPCLDLGITTVEHVAAVALMRNGVEAKNEEGQR